MATLTSPGIGSGLDVAGIVAQLVTAERAPQQTRLDTQEARALSKLSALGTIKGALGAFQSALEPLKSLDTFQGRTATSTNQDIFTASANTTAVPGRYAVEVSALATGSKIRSAAFATADTVVGSGTLTLSSGSEVFTVDVAPPNDTLEAIAASINDAVGNTQVLATIVNSVDGANLVLTSVATGLDSAITVQASGGDGGLDALVYDPLGGTTNMTEVTAPADASLLIDGLVVSAADNVVSDAISGVTINLVDAEPGETYDLSIGYDTNAARAQVETFVESYNALLDVVGSQTSFNPETFQSAPLFGESAIRNLTSQIRSTIGGFADDTASSFRSLVDLGVTTSLDGRLSIDSATLGDALAENFNDVGRLFSDEGGFATRLDELVSTFLEPTAALTTRTDGLETLIDDIGDRRDALDVRMLSVEARLTAQFSALDSLISQLDSTSAFLGQQLGNLPGFTNPNA